jgi:trypsin-like peptidase/tetratricopeptide repeat protein
MSWSDAPDIQNALDAALGKYQWTAVAAVCDRLICRIHEERSPYPEVAARGVLAALRKKRQFRLIVKVAEAFVRSGQDAPRIRRQYAQALIDQGILLAPEPILDALTIGPLEDSEVAEAHGLLGRIYKQLYINTSAPSSQSARLFFERAVTEYSQIYRLDPQRYTWHGINLVALIHRGAVDGINADGAAAANDIATRILTALPQLSQIRDAFDLATSLEALIALDRSEEATAAALAYVQHPDADAFEIGSTLRQLEEVWRLSSETPPGQTILPLLRAAKLKREGGALDASPRQIDDELRLVEQAKRDVAASPRLEKIFGDDRMVTLQWYETGLLRTKSVARVERLNGKGHGTGWLVSSDDFFPSGWFTDGKRRQLLLTNAHVVNPDGSGGALSADDARANFQGLGKIVSFDEIVWSSPPDEFDATFVTFKGDPPAAASMPVFQKRVRFTEPGSRLYIIGHPGGRDVELSLHDNLLIDCDDRLLRYRTPTEGGSSGSPVFEADDWRAVGLHHAGGTFERLDKNPPPYEANEGITVLAIKKAIAARTRTG